MVKVISGACLNQKQPSTGVYGCLQKNAFNRVAGLQSKKRLWQRCFPVSLPNISERFFLFACKQLFLEVLDN